MKRTYSSIILEHLEQDRQMIFVVGPRQMGKTTLCTDIPDEYHYFNWDNQNPWFMVEVKTEERGSINKDLFHFQKQINAPHAFQADLLMDYVGADCFSTNQPTTVPVKTLLSQLV